jgi:hypothetical protein
MVGLLGQVSDAEVGRRFELSTQVVRKQRLRLGIAAYRERGYRIAWTAELARLLRRPTREVCRVAGIGAGTVCGLRKELGVPAPPRRSSAWTPEVLARLGKVADAAVARELGTSIYVNMPNSEITGSKVFLLQQVSWQAAPRPSWSTSPKVFILQQQTETFHENGPELKADIEKTDEGVYKLTVPELSGKRGVAALKVVMPPGTADRLYLLRLQ